MGKLDYERLTIFESKVNAIFKKIMEENNLSPEELNELSKANKEIEFNLREYIEDQEFSYNILYNSYYKKIKSLNFFPFIYFLLILIFISAGVFSIGMIIPSLVIYNLAIQKSQTIRKDLREELNKLIAEKNLADSKLRVVSITLQNNKTHIFKYQKRFYAKDLEKLNENNLGSQKILQANELIQNYITNGIFPSIIDEDIKNIAIKILQIDLNSSTNSLKYLLIDAKARSIEESKTRTRHL